MRGSCGSRNRGFWWLMILTPSPAADDLTRIADSISSGSAVTGYRISKVNSEPVSFICSIPAFKVSEPEMSSVRFEIRRLPVVSLPMYFMKNEARASFSRIALSSCESASYIALMPSWGLDAWAGTPRPVIFSFVSFMIISHRPGTMLGLSPAAAVMTADAGPETTI